MLLDRDVEPMLTHEYFGPVAAGAQGQLNVQKMSSEVRDGVG